MPRITAVLNLLINHLGEDADLREHGRIVVLETLDRLDAKWWLEHRPLRVVPLVEELWWRCRELALFRRALPQALAWRGGLSGVAALDDPAGQQDPLEQAGRVGFAVVTNSSSSHEIHHRVSCGDRNLPCIVADLRGRYSGPAGVVESTEHAGVRLSLTTYPGSFSDAERAAIRATCWSCISPDDLVGAVSVTTCSVIAIVPLGLAIPLAARLREIAVRTGITGVAGPGRSGIRPDPTGGA